MFLSPNAACDPIGPETREHRPGETCSTATVPGSARCTRPARDRAWIAARLKQRPGRPFARLSRRRLCLVSAVAVVAALIVVLLEPAAKRPSAGGRGARPAAPAPSTVGRPPLTSDGFSAHSRRNAPRQHTTRRRRRPAPRPAPRPRLAPRASPPQQAPRQPVTEAPPTSPPSMVRPSPPAAPAPPPAPASPPERALPLPVPAGAPPEFM
jgi:hypothetical protein